MVAKISFGASLFGVLSYNGEKVKQGEGKILETNKVGQEVDADFNIRTCMTGFLDFMPSHHNIAKPIVHISLNPHPDDRLTDDQLSEIAIEYLEKRVDSLQNWGYVCLPLIEEIVKDYFV